MLLLGEQECGQRSLPAPPGLDTLGEIAGLMSFQMAIPSNLLAPKLPVPRVSATHPNPTWRPKQPCNAANCFVGAELRRQRIRSWK